MAHKAGFVNIIGNPNVGKSTLMNAILGEKLSITTSKAQTTRHRIMGIHNEEDYQIVFSDLPGILDPHYKLQEKMMDFINQALIDADVFIYMLEIGERKYNEEIVDKINASNIPTLVVINKVDKSDENKIYIEMEYWEKVFPKGDIIAISALHDFNVKAVLSRIKELLPESPPYYPKDELSDRTLRFFVSEIIREKILKNSYPMFLAASIMFLMSYIDSFMISYYLDEYQVGIYSACINLSLMITFIPTAIGGFISPKVSKYYSNNDFFNIKKIFNNSLIIIAIITLPIFLVLYFYAKEFLGLFGTAFTVATTTLLLTNIAFLSVSEFVFINSDPYPAYAYV